MIGDWDSGALGRAACVTFIIFGMAFYLTFPMICILNDWVVGGGLWFVSLIFLNVLSLEWELR